MNILIAGIFGYNSYSRGIMPDVLQTLINKYPEANISFLSCSNSFDVCYFNPQKQPDICFRCKAGNANTLELVSGNFTHLKIDDLITIKDRATAKGFFQNKPRIDFDQVYENFEVGEATLSTYISVTRDRDLKDVRQPFVKELAVNALTLYLGLQHWLIEKKIDVVYNFNGRQDYVRAVMRAAISKNIDCYNVEKTRLKGHIDFYKNSFPHDPQSKFELVETYWRESPLPLKEKERIGTEFYLRQRAGESVVFPSYTSKMKEGSIPEEALNGNKNIVLFNSSDDEIAAFGDLFQNPHFKDQNEGIKFLTNFVGQNLADHNLIIRMHPNLTGVRQDYVQEIIDLHQVFPNIYVIAPESAIDSYALMESAEKVVSFGSTTGLEATFMRKPVLLLGIGFFYPANYAFKPKNRSEIEHLLRAPLQPASLEDTLKVGFFIEQGGIKTLFYSEEKMGEGIYFKNRRVHFYSFSQRSKAAFIKVAHQLFNLRLKLKS
ncbi:capsular polysaccharide export protein, LipB/KpsS family [Salinimicrobium oceani]|uniref:Capsule polysaccharide biosynthesis protein n=1 Tax=Salinimicrobium oceani TaxID=2722702 RepID=A0ABX1CYT4_9FLAO|nr:hypothetical protein [Salinimicrobium oceani]NJW53427.1 hypothetical protein [Salinimicrobium oceani]